jgi:hypothetical protein
MAARTWDPDDLLIEGGIEGEEPLDDEAEVSPSRRRPLLFGAAAVLAVVGLAAADFGGDSTTGPPLVTRTTEPARTPDLALLPYFEGDAFLGVRENRAFQIDVDDQYGTVQQVLTRRGGLVASLSGGTARWWSQRTPDGVDLGPATAIFPAAEPDEVWLVEPEGSRWAVRRDEVGSGDDSDTVVIPPSIIVPRRATVVGAVSGVLVTARHADQPGTVRLWDPDTGGEAVIAEDAVVLTAGVDRVAVAEDDDVVVLAGPDWSEAQRFPDIAAGVDQASFSPDGRFLALGRSGNGILTTLDLEAFAPEPITTELGDAAGGPSAWVEDRLLVSAPGSFVVVVEAGTGEARRIGPVGEQDDRD